MFEIEVWTPSRDLATTRFTKRGSIKFVKIVSVVRWRESFVSLKRAGAKLFLGQNLSNIQAWFGQFWTRPPYPWSSAIIDLNLAKFPKVYRIIYSASSSRRRSSSSPRHFGPPGKNKNFRDPFRAKWRRAPEKGVPSAKTAGGSKLPLITLENDSVSVAV